MKNIVEHFPLTNRLSARIQSGLAPTESGVSEFSGPEAETVLPGSQPMRLRHLPIFSLEAGMVLGRPILLVEQTRVTLNLPAGASISAAMLPQLAMHKAEYACIQEPDMRTEQARESSHRQAEARLDEIFRGSEQKQSSVRTLYDALLAHRNTQ